MEPAKQHKAPRDLPWRDGSTDNTPTAPGRKKEKQAGAGGRVNKAQHRDPKPKPKP